MHATSFSLPSRAPLRDLVFSALSDTIARGEFRPGDQIRETALASRLGTSRTPMREALVRLVDCGLLEFEQGYGFRVAPMSSEELSDSYDVLTVLELHAFERCEPCTTEQATELHALISAAKAKAADPVDALRLDAAWHKTLLKTCRNSKLHSTLDNMRRITVRYEAAYFINKDWADRSFQEHEDITRAFEAGKRDLARDVLKRHWIRSGNDLRSGLFGGEQGDDD